MSKSFQYQATNTTITVIIDGQTYTATEGQPHYRKLRCAALAGDFELVKSNLKPSAVISSWSKGSFKLQGGGVHYQGEAVPKSIGGRILEGLSVGEDVDKYLHFYSKLNQNPSHRSVNQLWKFLEHKALPIAPDGDILAYKGIREDFTDVHSGKFNNSVGETLQMQRNRVSDDPTIGCHFGFHVGALSYAKSFGKVVVIVKFSPTDVVCVPHDCSHQKVRVCKYSVVGIGSNPLDEFLVEDSDYDTPVEPENVASGEDETQVHTDETPLQKGETLPIEKDFKADWPRHGTEWDHMHEMDFMALMKESSGTLRKYARHNCGVFRPGHVKGGKSALVPAIIEARGFNTPPKKDS